MKNYIALFACALAPLFLNAQTVTLNEPADGSTVWAGIQLDWYAASGINYGTDQYQLQLASDIGFSTIVVDESLTSINSASSNSDTRYNIEDIRFGETYYWRVRVLINGTTPGAWSEARSFNTRDYVTPDLPADEANVWTGVTIDWYSHDYVDAYQWEADTTSNFNSPAKRSGENAYINTVDSNNDTEELLSDLYFGKTYYWRVRAINAVDTSEWSVARSFNTRDYVTPDLPADEANVWTGVTIDWYSHDYVDAYQWEADTTSNFNSPAKRSGENAYINAVDSNNDTEELLSDLYFGKTYYWRVRAINAVDTSEWSVARSFNTRDYVTPDLPADEANVWTGVTIDWYSHDYVDAYQWEADTTSNFNSPAKRSGENAYINTVDSNNDTEELLSDLYFGKTYYWRVRAINAVDTSEWSVVRSFNTRDYVTPDLPEDEANVWTGITIDWYSHDYVDAYQWEADTTADFNSPAKLSGEDAYINTYDGNTDTEEALSDLYFGKTYYWRVRAINAVDTSEWSVVRSFNTRDYVSLSYPENLATGVSTSGIDLDWYSHDGISYYEYQSDSSNLFNSPALISGEKAYINTYDGNSDTEQFTGELAENTWYCWRVRARNAVDTSAWSMRWFSTGNEELLLPQTPILSAPSDNSNYQYVDISLEWLTADNATSYSVLLADNPEFNSPIINEETSNLNYDVIGLNDQTTYYWKIQGNDGTNFSDWSTVWSFQTGLQQTTLSSPADGAESVPYLITNLEWLAVENATKYEVAMSTDESFTTIQFNDTVFSTIAHAYYAMNTEYFWKVRAINEFQTGEWSEIWSFTTDSEVSSEINIENSFEVYPNPAKTSIVCQFQNRAIDQFSIKIYDMNGKILLEKSGYNGYDAIDISQLSAGFYVIQCASKSVIYQTQFIKQ